MMSKLGAYYQVRVTELGRRIDAVALKRMLVSATMECLKLARAANRGAVRDPNGLEDNEGLWIDVVNRLRAARALTDGELRINRLSKAAADEIHVLYSCCLEIMSVRERAETGIGVFKIHRDTPRPSPDRTAA